MEQPLVHWVPSISPSGITIYNGNLFPKWKGNLFIANLSGSHVRRLVFDEKFKVQKQEVLLDSLSWRFRDIQSGPDGKIYISSDHGTIAALSPVK
jgi:glucose/arabinose dehydrogenase